jgi:hypothetical protein
MKKLLYILLFAIFSGLAISSCTEEEVIVPSMESGSGGSGGSGGTGGTGGTGQI